MKRASLLKFPVIGLIVVLALIASAGAATGSPTCEPVNPQILRCVDTSLAPGTVWQIFPSDLDAADPLYGLVDADNIQLAIDLAMPGDTLILKAGTFVFARESVPDFDIQTASGSFRFYEDWLDPWSAGLLASPIHQSININKEGLTLTGETGADGEPLTFITSPLDLYEADLDYWAGYNGVFVINANHVSLANLQIEQFVMPVMAFGAGFDIHNNRFIDCGFPIILNPDNWLTYPNWPNTNGAIKSYFRNNRLINNAQAPFVTGSEIVVEDNYMEFYLLGLLVSGWGEPFPNNRGLAQNNIIQGNELVCTPHYWAILRVGVAIWNYANNLVNTQVIDNTIQNCGWGINSTDQMPSEDWNNIGTVISGNRLINIRRNAINLYSYFDPDGVTGSIVTNNYLENVGWSGTVPGGVWIEVGVKQSKISGNDYTQSPMVGWGLGAGLVWLDPGTQSNHVKEYLFPPETTLCDQILDLGSNSVVGYGVCLHNPAQAVHLQDIFAKSKEGNGLFSPLLR